MTEIIIWIVGYLVIGGLVVGVVEGVAPGDKGWHLIVGIFWPFAVAVGVGVFIVAIIRNRNA